MQISGKDRTVQRSCLLGGTLWALLAWVVIWAKEVSTRALWANDMVLFVIGGFFALICGLLVAFLCSIVAMPCLRHKRLKTVVLWNVGVVSPVVAVLALTFGKAEMSSDSPEVGFVPIVLGSAGAFLLTVLILWQALPNVYYQSKLCRTCGHDLRGLVVIGRCPECGSAFEPKELQA